jgi:hypothetical protein
MRLPAFLLGICIFTFGISGIAGTSPVWGVTSSIYSAGVIRFPTALDQTEDNTFHGTVEIEDIGEPDLAMSNARWGLQIGNFQLLTDLHLETEPGEAFDFGEIRGKLRVLPLDEISTDIAVGLLFRFAESGEKQRFDDKEASIFGIITTQLDIIPDAEEPLMLNLYLDNLFVSIGIELGVYQFIKVVAESDYLHSTTDVPDRSTGRLGIEIEGEQNFYFQLFYTDSTENFVVQVGTGF